ncbi:hypothetical protein AXG93_1089s1030 [Marchantia polymorpha subsp. ruderalis]|uniref:OTU domain-containing protein n=1 Tax=Marchantia polymorpha subsp. ruderalis TaxID=1480154 RepID=A0A176WG63_MARPO|nr:hypothetical protein AXG93_1089s1030 [Marchantia polymorpha subsp. ruderalis]
MAKQDIRDVAMDGNCGFHAVAAALNDMHPERNMDWRQVRRDLLGQYKQHHHFWDGLFGKTENIQKRLDWFQSGTALVEHWFDAPPAAILAADVYTRLLVFLDEDTKIGNYTYVPFHTSSGSTTPICLVFVRKNHWQHATLKTPLALHPIFTLWRTRSDKKTRESWMAKLSCDLLASPGFEGEKDMETIDLTK